MQTLIDGATAVAKFQVLDEAGVPQTINGWALTAKWLASPTVTPATPTWASADATTWLVIASTVGLGGNSATLRVQGDDPITGKVFIADLEYLVKK